MPTIPAAYILTLLLAAVRLSGLLLAAPVFGARTIPAPAKVAASFAIAAVLFPPGTAAPPPAEGLIAFGVLAARELAIGVIAGFAIQLVFAAVQMAASLIGVQMGLGMAGVLDPTFQQLSTPLEQFYNLLAALIFLGADLHHHALIGFAALFQVLPLGQWAPLPNGLPGVTSLFAGVMLAALEIALPLIGALLLTDLAMGIMGRFVPQMNLMFVGMPIKVAVGLIITVLALPLLLVRFQGQLATAPSGMRMLLP